MEIILNGQSYQYDGGAQGLPLQEFLRNLSIPTEATAIALNNEIIPHSLWSETRIKEKDSVEIIRAVGGG
ncbi:MAG: sulfur carrier protein ThiS [Deltaproteobacteria bacterium]|nr:sulfur carrier protein ThiS [Deltaproteobacteria bacterium]